MMSEAVLAVQRWLPLVLAAGCAFWGARVAWIAASALRKLHPPPSMEPTREDLAFLRRLHIRY